MSVENLVLQINEATVVHEETIQPAATQVEFHSVRATVEASIDEDGLLQEVGAFFGNLLGHAKDANANALGALEGADTATAAYRNAARGSENVPLKGQVGGALWMSSLTGREAEASAAQASVLADSIEKAQAEITELIKKRIGEIVTASQALSIKSTELHNQSTQTATAANAYVQSITGAGN